MKKLTKLTKLGKLLTIVVMSSFTVMTIMDHIDLFNGLPTLNFLGVYLGFATTLTFLVYSWTLPNEPKKEIINKAQNTFKKH